MSEQAAFHEAMRADPEDNTTRLVYADWLDDHGMHEPARRIRWWVGLRHHMAVQDLRGGDTAVAGEKWAPPADLMRSVPNWVARLIQTEYVRDRFKGTPQEHRYAPQLHASELHALGLGDLPAFPTAVFQPNHHRAVGVLLTPSMEHGATTQIIPSRYAEWHNTAPGFHHEHFLARAVEHARENPPEGPTKLAAIESQPGGTVLVRVPTPNAPAPQPQATPPVAKQATPSVSSGSPAFILPQ